MTNGNIKAVCSWIGNSPAIAMQHYAQITEADMKEAAEKAVILDAETVVQNTVHNTVHTGAESSRKDSQEVTGERVISPCICGNKEEFAGACESVRNSSKWAVLDLNQRPPACRAGALAN